MKRVWLLLLLLCCNVLLSQQYYTASQRKLMARRAAIMDGYRQVAETIQGLSITTNVQVRDFIIENDEISASLQQLIVRGSQIGATRYLADNSCEVEISLNVEDLIRFLQNNQNQFQLPRWRNVDFRNITRSYSSPAIRATGLGVPPGELSQQELDNLILESQSTREQLAQLKSEVQDLKEKEREAQDKIVTMTQTVSELGSYKQKFMEVSGQYRQVQTRLKKYQENFDVAESYRQKYENTLKDMKKLEEQILEIPKLQTLAKENAQKYQQTLAESQTMQTQITVHLKKLEEMQNIFKYYKLYRGKYEDYVKKNQEAFEKIRVLQSQLLELQNLREKASQLTSDLDNLRKEDEQVRAQMTGTQNALQEKLEEEKKSSQRLRAENSRLIEEIKNLQNTIGELNTKVAQMEEDKVNLQSQLPGAWVAVPSEQKMRARQTAILDGYRQLQEALKNINLDARTTVGNCMAERDDVHAAIRGFVRLAQVKDTRYMPDGMCEVDMTIELRHFFPFLHKVVKQYRPDLEGKWEDIGRAEPRKMIKVVGTGSIPK